MDQLIESCRKSNHYPCNLVLPQQAQYDLNNKKVILRNLSSRTFITDESEARVDFWEYRGHSFQHATVTDRQSLREHLNLGNQRPDELPSSRFIFLQAPHSRAKLLVSEDMLLDLLSYFQVMSSIVHALESFGLDAKKDFQHCQFEANNRLQQYEAGLRVPELKRSGHMLELCYSLRSVERSDSIEGRTTWSFKQTCVYHSFDVSTGLTTWIVIKGSDLFKKRIMDTSNASIFPGIKSFTTVSDAFASALAVQLIFGDWTTENWRWFVNDLEKEVQSVTRAVTFKPVTPPAAALSTTSLDPITPVANSTLSERARSWACGQLSRTSTGKTFLDRFNIENPVPRPTTDVLSPTNMQASQVNTSTSHDIRREEESYFETLQRVKALEERASEALLVLKTTTRILKRLQRTYADLSDDEDFPTVIQKDCKRKLKQFNRRLQDMQDVLENEALRVETLSTLLVGRKALLNSILDWRSMRSSNDLAVQATKSSLKMEDMTSHMQDIADRTEKETVSMRIITLVTMFFLPATFISTLMSTDIVKFKENEKVYSSSALKLFLTVALPMTFFTFCAWYIVYWWVNNRERLQRARKHLQEKLQV